MYDPVLERIWRTRRKIAREFNYDVEKYARYIKERHDRRVEERRKAGKPLNVITREEILRTRKQDMVAEPGPSADCED